MTMYDAIYEKLQERYESGELTFEDAERLNRFAYDKYMSEAKEASKDEEMVQCLLQKVQDGFKLPKKLKECIEDCCSESDEKEEPSDEAKDDAPVEDAEEPAPEE